MITSEIQVQKNSARIPFPGCFKCIGQHQDRQMPRSIHSISAPPCRSMNDLPKNREEKGAKMSCNCLWPSPIGKSLSSYIFGDHETKGIFPSFFCSAGAAPDVPLNGARQEEKFSKSSASSDPKILTGRTLKLHSGSCYLPHPDKEETGGEDAHFICDELAIGVADGVGGWAKHGIDAGKYARELMKYSSIAIKEEPRGSINPMKVLEKAYLSTEALGSSTACIIALKDKGIHAANLGDSGFIVVRNGCTIFQSPAQLHGFNFTYQLQSGGKSDQPSSAQITDVLGQAMRAGLGPKGTAEKLGAFARERAQDKARETPYSTAIQKLGYQHNGGKLDDITVLVSFVITSADICTSLRKYLRWTLK